MTFLSLFLSYRIMARPYEPANFVGSPFMQPSAKFLLGTDFHGRDILPRLLYGRYPVVWMVLSATTISMILGTSAGLVAAYAKG